MIRRIQRDSEAWRVAVYGDRPIEHRAMKLTEEAAEVVKYLTRKAEGRSPGDLDHELADVVIAACGVASAAGIDLEAAIEARWNVIRGRR